MIWLVSTNLAFSEETVSCKKIKNFYWENAGRQKTCHLDESVQILSKFTKIYRRDESVTGLLFWQNSRIKYLPIQMSEKIPNLVAIDAQSCSVTEISYENFAGLNKLQNLILSRNKIERVYADTFKDLINLKWLALGKQNFYM